MPDTDLVAMVLAKRQAKANAARASQDQAAAAARAKPRVSDPDSSVSEAPKKPSVDVNAETRVTNPIDVPKPADTSNYDFEAHSTPVETDLHSTASAPSSAATEAMPANKGPLASKVAEAKSPMNAPARPLKTIAQDVAEVKAPPAPKSPLPGQGVNATGPVKPAFYNEKGKATSKPNLTKPVRKITPPKVESSNPAPAAEKVMTPEGSVEKVAAKAPTKVSGVSSAAPKAEGFVQNYPARLRLADDAGAIKNFGQSTVEKVAGKEGPSLAAKASSVLRKAPSAVKGLGSLAKGTASTLDDVITGGAIKGAVAPYQELRAARAAGTAAKTGIRALGGEALALGKGISSGIGGAARMIAVQAAGEGGARLGTAAKEGLDEAKSNAESQKRAGAKYGLKVESSADTKDSSNFLGQTARDVGNAVKVAAGFADPTPSVSIDPDLKAKFMSSNKKRINKMQDEGSIPRQYSRATIKGSTGKV